MKIDANKLRKIIIEEYIKEENLTEVDQEEIEKLLRQIQGDKYREPEERDPARYNKNFGDTAPMKKPHHEPDGASADMPASPEEQIAAIVSGMEPDAVAEIFNAVFSKMQPGQEEPPETLYRPGAEGRPQAGFRLEELKAMIRQVLAEGHYHDMGGEDEMYDVLDPHGFGKMSDAELMIAAERDGIEEIVVTDNDGDLVNREEVIAALKSV
jgi:hypothetical protein